MKINDRYVILAIFFFSLTTSCKNERKSSDIRAFYVKLVKMDLTTPNNRSSEPVSSVNFQLRIYNRSENEIKIPLESFSREYSFDDFVLIKKDPAYVLPIKFDGHSSNTKRSSEAISYNEFLNIPARDSVDLYYSNSQDKIAEIIRSDFFDKKAPENAYTNYINNLFSNDFTLILKIDSVTTSIDKNAGKK